MTHTFFQLWGLSLLMELCFLNFDFFPPGWSAHVVIGAFCILGSRMCIHLICSCHLLAHRSFATGCFSFAPCLYVPLVWYNGIQAGNLYFSLFYTVYIRNQNSKEWNRLCWNLSGKCMDVLSANHNSSASGLAYMLCLQDLFTFFNNFFNNFSWIVAQCFDVSWWENAR